MSERNQERVQRVETSLAEYDEGGKTGVTDMLTDLLHFCDANKINFDSCMTMARIHHDEEK